MKVLMINGSPHKKGCTFTALSEIADTLTKEGIESEILHLARILSGIASPAANVLSWEANAYLTTTW